MVSRKRAAASSAPEPDDTREDAPDAPDNSQQVAAMPSWLQDPSFSHEGLIWLAQQLVAAGVTNRRLLTRDVVALARIFLAKDNVAPHQDALMDLLDRLNLAAGNWSETIEATQLPAVALVPQRGYVFVYAAGQPQEWMVETQSGRERIRFWPEGTVFLPILPKHDAANDQSARALFQDVLKADRAWVPLSALATTIASILVLGTSLYSMQVYDRVIGQGGFSTLVVLTVGVIIAVLMESELFGHERGAFTGAAAKRIGRFEEAHGGTLFLDEIGDMRCDMQVKLLRVLEDVLVQRPGGGPAIAADARIVSATHQDLDEAILAGRFREDLYFRLGVVPIRVPALAERAEDVPLLIAHFQAQRQGRRHGDAVAPARFEDNAIARLMAYEWPGNVRELRNVVARADILFGGMKIGVADVEALLCLSASRPLRAADLPQLQASPRRSARPAASHDPIDLKQVVEALEQDRIHMALEAADGVISEAARLLTLKRTTLIEKMRKYGVGKQVA